MRINHIGIAVHDIQAALQVYESALGMVLTEIVEVPAQKVRVAFLPVGESNLELVQPTSEDSPTARFLEKRGEGIHHVCLEVEDLEAALARLQDQGVPLIDQVPRPGAHGRVAFVHPKGTHGVLLELVEYSAG
jgi:methylmalonyl-CoA epimerase